MWARVAIAMTLFAGRAHAQCAPSSDLPCEEAYARWSLLPELSALASWGPNGGPSSLLGAELRLRRNEPSQHLTGAYALGLGVETLRMATVEPYVTIARDELAHWCTMCSNNSEVFGTAHLAVGGGLAWSEAHRGEPFVLARISFGLTFARPAGRYIAVDGERGEVGATRFRLSSQVDLVLETAIAADGEWRFAMGAAIDPFRIIQDAAALFE